MILLCLTPDDFTMSDGRRFYYVWRQTILLCLTADDFTMSNGRFYLERSWQDLVLYCQDPVWFRRDHARILPRYWQALAGRSLLVFKRFLRNACLLGMVLLGSWQDSQPWICMHPTLVTKYRGIHGLRALVTTCALTDADSHPTNHWDQN